jgi:hypothetical protein
MSTGPVAMAPAHAELFADPGARVVWADVQSLPESIHRALLAALAEQMQLPELRETVTQPRQARAVTALWEARDLLRAERDAAGVQAADEPPVTVEAYRRLRGAAGMAAGRDGAALAGPVAE